MIEMKRNKYTSSMILCWVAVFFMTGCYTGPSKTVMKRRSEISTPADVSAGESSKMVKWNTRPSDEVAPGFQIEVKSTDDKAVNGIFAIPNDGVLKLPYDVKVDTTGLTLAQLNAEIVSAYKKFFTSPQIKVSVFKKEYYVDVRGLVQKPGQYLVKEDSSLDYLISQAGGLLGSSDKNSEAQFVRIDQLGVTNVFRLRDYFSGNQNLVPKWQGGESVFFQSERGSVAGAAQTGRNYIQIIGMVKTPGEYPYKDNADLYDYLIKAGGPTERADLYKFDLIRTSGKERVRYTFALDDSDKVPDLRPGDTIFVHADNPTPAEKSARVVTIYTSILTAIATTIIAAAAL
jgi:protein involved in polysaccharide export with SLBB domain